MTVRHRLLLLATATALSLVGGAGPALASANSAHAAIAAPTLTEKPTTGPPGTKEVVSGTGFTPGETVKITFGSTQVGTATASSTGTFSDTFVVPKSAAPGVDTVTATGQSSGLTATAKFLVNTNWPQLRYDNSGVGVNPYENVINATNVSKLTQDWVEPSPSPVNLVQPPALYNGVLYAATSLGGIAALNPANGKVLWTGFDGGGNLSGGSVHTPTVVNGIAYIASADGIFAAYAAKASSAHCTNNLTKCAPIWQSAVLADAGGNNDQGTAVVANGMVYISAGSQFYAFNAKGCGKTICPPKWITALGNCCSSPVSGDETPAVVGSNVYAAGADGIWVYSTSGQNCTGTAFVNMVCSPLWHGTNNSGGFEHGSVAVSGGVVYSVLDAGFGEVLAWSAAGCATPDACQPTWVYRNATPMSFSSVAVANGKVYANGTDSKMRVFGTTGSSAGKVLWTAPSLHGNTGFESDPVVANGLVYAGWRTDLGAYSANGTTNCSGTPLVCQPIFTLVGPNAGFGGIWQAGAIVANGTLYAGEGNGTNFGAYSLP